MELPFAQGGAVPFADGGNFLLQLLKKTRAAHGVKAAERAEQALDTASLGHFNPDALSEVFDRRNPGLLTVMRPSEFEKYAWPLPKEWMQETPYRGSQAGMNNFGGSYSDYIKSLKDVAEGGGFDQTPALWFGASKVPGYTGNYRVVRGHDGRHRMRAL